MAWGWDLKTRILLLHSEEKIRRRFDVQQPDEHWQEETLLTREP